MAMSYHLNSSDVSLLFSIEKGIIDDILLEHIEGGIFIFSSVVLLLCSGVNDLFL